MEEINQTSWTVSSMESTAGRARRKLLDSGSRCGQGRCVKLLLTKLALPNALALIAKPKKSSELTRFALLDVVEK